MTDFSTPVADATRTSVNSGTSLAMILASNANRKGATIFNSDANALLLDLSGGTATTTRCQVRLTQYQNYEVGSGYTGTITGVWEADGAGRADVVEFTCGTPTPTPTPMTKVAAEGDSITAAAGSGISTWMAANFTGASQNFAISASVLGKPTDAPNPTATSMFARLPSVIAYNPTDLITAIGANDLAGGNWDFDTWTGYLLTYRANARAGASNLVRIFAGEVLPRGPGPGPTYIDYVTFNARRALVNDWLRGQVGQAIDGLLPYGTHPVLGADAAATTSLYDSNNLHPTASGPAIMRAIVNAVLDPVVALATGSTPVAFVFTDQANAALSTDYTPGNVVLVTGMGLGETASGSASSPGELARGIGAFGTSALDFMNGDAPVPKLTSSASYTTEVDTTVTIGGVSDTFAVTTAANVTPVGYATIGGQEASAGFTSSFTFGDIVIPAGGGRFFFIVYSFSPTRQPGAFKFTKSGVDTVATQIDAVNTTTLWYADLPAGTYTPSMTAANQSFYYVGLQGILATNCASHSGKQKLTATAYNNPVVWPSSQAVNTNEMGLVFLVSGSTVSARNDGSTQRSTLTINDTTGAGLRYATIATLPATATPSVNLSGGNAVAGGYAITAAP